MKYNGDVPICKAGHDKRAVGVEANGWCSRCKAEADRLYKTKKKRAKDSYNGECVLMPGLREVREAVGLKIADLARAVGVHRRTIERIENGEMPPGLATRRKVEQVIAAKGSKVARLYGSPGLLWRECGAGLGHPAWESATILACPRCTVPKGGVVEPNSLGPEELKALTATIPDRGQFDFILNERGAAIRAAFTGDREADVGGIVDVLEEEEEVA